MYVGYRYFDSVGKRVLFPFGYGLTFTEFEHRILDVCLEGTSITVSAVLRNVGVLSGKEVLQLYVSVPEGNLNQPYQVLAGWEKTDEELVYMNIGAFNASGAMANVIGNAAFSVAGAAGQTTLRCKEKGIPSVVMADGPAGVRVAKDYYEDEKGVHALGEIMPESMMMFVNAPIRFVLNLISKRKNKIKGELLHNYATAIPIGTAIPKSIMTSYNLLNGIHTSERRDLNEDILRREFGFDGMVMTDWVVGDGLLSKSTKHPGAVPYKVVLSGNDVFMPGCQKDFDNIMGAFREGKVSRKILQVNATRVYTLAKELCQG